MRGISPGRWMRPLAAMLLAIAAMGVLSPSKVLAGCDHAAASRAYFEHLVDTGAMTDLPSPNERPKPCTGPMCSKLPASPPTSGGGVVSIEPWAILTAGVVIAPDAPSPARFDPAREVGERHGPSIFHPPR